MESPLPRLITPLRLFLLTGSALLLPAAALAQEAQPEEEEALPAEEMAPPAPDMPEELPSQYDGNEIVVTAGKREQTLQDVPLAVSVVTADALERTQVRDLKDLPALVPALRVVQLQSSAQTNFIIRGFGNGANNPGIEPSVGVFVDGVYRSRSAAQIADLPDVERIEVLRGPQSTLFGKNASAGVISLVTRQPQFTFGGNVEATYGKYDAKVLRGYVTGPITEQIAASLSAGFHKRDGYVRDLGVGDESNGRSRWFVRGQLRVEPSTQLTLRVIADFDEIDETCCAVVNLRRSAATSAIELLGGRLNDAADPFGNTVWSNFASSNHIENWGLSGQATYQIGPLAFTSITAWRESHARTNQDSDFTSAALIGQNLGDVDIGTFTQELRASVGFASIFNAMLGAFLIDEDIHYGNALTYGAQFRPYIDLLSSGEVTALETSLNQPAGTFGAAGQGMFDEFALRDTSWSLFGTLDVTLRQKFKLSLGGNFTKDRKRVSSNSLSTDVFSALDLSSTAPALVPLQFFPPFVNFPNLVESGRTSDADWSWNARLSWNASDAVNVYAGYATGFKASSFNLSRDSRPLAADLPALASAGLTVPNLVAGSRLAGPEDSRVVEAGIKATWPSLSANLAVFRQTIDGFQSNVFTGSGFALANAGRQSTFGVEFDSVVRPSASLALTVAAAWLRPRYDSFQGSPLGDLSGKRPAGIPTLSATAGAQWNHRLDNGNRLVLRADFHYESPVQVVDGLPGFITRDSSGQVLSYQPAIAAALPYRREVTELGASVTYGFFTGFELSVWGRNLTDDRYLVSVFDSVGQPGSVSGYPNQPRTFGATARFRW